MDATDLPDNLYDAVQRLKSNMRERSIGHIHGQAEGEYEALRKIVLYDVALVPSLPKFVRNCRTLPEFWAFIKNENPTYAGRQRILQDEFAPALDYLEKISVGPADDAISVALAVVDSTHVQQAWRKATDRRVGDPDGAITAARTLLESVCKHILDELNVAYDDKSDDLPALYGRVAQNLNLAPNQQTEQMFKQTLGGCQTVANGIAAMRN